MRFAPRSLVPTQAGEVLLDENQVLAATADALEAAGWTIEQLLRTDQRGIDLIARRGDECLHVEGKGATSSKEEHGKLADVAVHVPEAVARAIRAAGDPSLAARQAVAFPANRWHRRYVEGLLWALELLGISVFWVAPDGTVESAFLTSDGDFLQSS